MTKQTIYVSASYLKNTNCWRKFFYSNVERIALKTASSHLAAAQNYGQAMGMFLDAYHCGVPYNEAIEPACVWLAARENNLEVGEFRDSAHLRCAAAGYVKEVPYTFFKPVFDKSSNKRRIQDTFEILFWENDYYRIVLCGTIDMVAEYAGIPEVIVDDKTSGARKEQFFWQYEHGIQPMFYSYCEELRNPRGRYLPFLVNAILVKKPTLKAAKEGRGWDGAIYERSTLFEFSQPMMEQFKF